MIILTVLNDRFFADDDYLAVSAQSHTFVTLVVSFLLVSRVNTALSRYSSARSSLSIMYRESRELVQSACVFSGASHDLSSKEWRHELAYRSMALLRVVMAVIDFPTTKIAAWEVSELNGAEREDVERTIFLNPDLQRLSHSESSEQSVWKETMRVPVRLAYALRKTIHSQNQRVAEPAHVALESRLHGSVDAFMQGYYGMRVFLTTPVPFPLVQMARTFLFLYVFTIPFVLLADKSGLLAHVGAVFVMTYGFVGLELVAIELDNPFGDDDNDFDNEYVPLCD